VFKKMLLAITIIFSTCLSACADSGEELAALGDEYIQVKSRYFPVWGTMMGIHDYDSSLANYTPDSIFTYRNKISMILQKLRRMDPQKLNADDNIDYQLLLANIKYDEFALAKFPFHEHSAALYLDEAAYSLYSILMDKSRTDEEKAPFLLARLKAIPAFLEQKWQYQSTLDKIFYEAAVDIAKSLPDFIDEVSVFLFRVLPDSSRRIARYTSLATSSIESYGMFCEIEGRTAPENHFMGKDRLNYLLKNIYFLNINADSLIKIGWHWYEKADAAMDSIQMLIDIKQTEPAEPGQKYKPLTKEDILAYYQYEIDQTALFIKDHDIVTIPEDIGGCIPMEMPEFLLPMHRGIAYQPPAPFSDDQTGYFYVQPIPPLDSLTTIKYNDIINNRAFKGSVVHEAYPGHHLQLSLANRHPSTIRRLQKNIMMMEGWALYCEQMATEQGLFDDDDLDRRWLGVYGGIRYRAARIIVDCCLADSSMTPDSALVFMNNMLGENTDYFKAEIRRYCTYPTVALSYLTGKLIILDMLEKARLKEGNSFSLKKFHDKILAEGSIPPPLIAQKLGY
jgi:uncharacterized protein (DUF885 family)